MIEQQHILGYFGAKIMAKKIQELGFWWPKMTKDIAAHIKQISLACTIM
jgi:hypothetical protein